MKHITSSAIAPPLHVTQTIDDLSLRSLQSLPEPAAPDLHPNARIVIQDSVLVLQHGYEPNLKV